VNRGSPNVANIHRMVRIMVAKPDVNVSRLYANGGERAPYRFRPVGHAEVKDDHTPPVTNERTGTDYLAARSSHPSSQNDIDSRLVADGRRLCRWGQQPICPI